MKQTLRHQRRPLSTLRACCTAFAALAFVALAPAGANAESTQSAIVPMSHALSPQSTLDGAVVFGAVFVAAILALLYVRGMYLVLHYTSLTYGVSLESVDDADYSSRRERRLLSIGSVALVVVSAIIIASYGFGWELLYIGPALSLLGPIVIIASMESDIRKYRKALGEATQTSNVVASSAVA